MVQQCAVYGCKSRGGNQGIKFYRFPYARGICTERIERTNLRRKRWFVFLKRKDIRFEDVKTRRICSKHFVTGKPAETDDLSHIDWVPTLQPPNKKSNDVSIIQRHSRRLNREKRNEIMTNDETVSKTIEATKSHEIQTDVTVNTFEEVIETDRLTARLRVLEQELKQITDDLAVETKKNEEFLLKKDSFLDKNGKLEFYTGLPNMAVVELVLNTINQGLNQISAQKLDNFQKLLLSLMKLRLNLSYQDLAYRFNVSNRTAENVFQKVMVMLKYSFQTLIHWPDRECLKLSMPRCFVSKYGYSVTVIIDCFEIAMQKPSTMRVRNQSWSEYKQKNTTKYLIGITPHGAISFISDGFAGHTTDTDITMRSGILDKIIDGDVILADHGFPVKGLTEVIAAKGAVMKTSVFKNEIDQLHSTEIEQSEDIAAVRIHVERVINCVRQKYTLLNGPVPLQLLKTSFEDCSVLDCAVHVACMLTNLCDSAV